VKKEEFDDISIRSDDNSKDSDFDVGESVFFKKFSKKSSNL
jgi:hypothetical protein